MCSFSNKNTLVSVRAYNPKIKIDGLYCKDWFIKYMNLVNIQGHAGAAAGKVDR